MSTYLFNGRLRANICDECLENLGRIQVRLYRHREKQSIGELVAANPKHTFSLLSDDDVKAKGESLLAETVTDENGHFSVTLGNETDGYDGGPFEIDVRITQVPGDDPDRKHRPRQFTVTSLSPDWEMENDRYSAQLWDYIVAARFWCHILALFDVWVICGRLVTCEGRQPVPGAIVRAFDADWLQHDNLGSASTDFSGYFRIYYTSAAFRRTPFSPAINVELIGGPDLFFQAELGGDLIINENASAGRQAERENAGNCFCIELCTDAIVPPDADEIPHWERVEGFEVDTDFSPEGYAGAGSLVMNDNVDLHGNMPLVNAVNGKALKYRFVVGAWTWPGGVEDPSTLPSIPPADGDLVPITSLGKSTAGYIYYTDANGDPSSAPVIVKSSDLDGDGCITLLGFQVSVDMHDGTTALRTVTEDNFVGSYLLMKFDSHMVTPAPYDVLDNLGLAAAGSAVAAGDRAPIRRFKLRFQVYDFDATVNKTASNKTLDSLVIDNSPVRFALHVTELAADLCNPISNNVHILYTIDHPHLRYCRVTIENNSGVVHDAPPLPTGTFSGNLFFRGAESGAAGFPVDVTGDPPCAYAVKLAWRTRHYHGNRDDSRSTQILYCK